MINAILEAVKESELGDIVMNRFDILIKTISKNAVVVGCQNKINEKYKYYRCWDMFYFEKEHTWYRRKSAISDSGFSQACQEKENDESLSFTWYEYTKWIGSFDDMCENGVDVTLKCTIKDGIDANKIIKGVLPNLEYQLDDDILNITSENYNKLF